MFDKTFIPRVLIALAVILPVFVFWSDAQQSRERAARSASIAAASAAEARAINEERNDRLIAACKFANSRNEKNMRDELAAVQTQRKLLLTLSASIPPDALKRAFELLDAEEKQIKASSKTLTCTPAALGLVIIPTMTTTTAPRSAAPAATEAGTVPPASTPVPTTARTPPTHPGSQETTTSTIPKGRRRRRHPVPRPIMATARIASANTATRRSAANTIQA
jgi:hypothetical protein